MEALEMLRTRHSVRVFTQEAVFPELIETIVDCGRLAATAINIQPWEFVAVTERDRLCQVAEATDHGKFIAQAAACIAVLCRETKYYLEDGSAATQNILLACRALGLGACWIAGDKKAYADNIRRMLGAPDGFRLVSLVALGHPAEDHHQPKRPLIDVLHWESY